MWEKFKAFLDKQLNNFFNGFSNHPEGWSGKKLTAFAVTGTSICTPMVLYSIWAYNKGDWSLFPALLAIVVGFVAGLFTINTWDKSKNKPTDNTKPNA